MNEITYDTIKGKTPKKIHETLTLIKNDLMPEEGGDLLWSLPFDHICHSLTSKIKKTLNVQVASNQNQINKLN
ncbi:hypothetical protein H5410_013129 [Solanum commersonii]|uniref:Uncharacterized protein n=1 Tax=Solanum commersonii TaxID=4109 RepID=A0A9J6AUU0_SOLCO|nr:hypothetical protein H5410_013129 [Solanum commersonii]